MLRRRNPSSKECETVLHNQVLRTFEPQVLDFLQDHLADRPMTAGEILYRDEDLVTHLIFPHSGVVSLQSIMRDGRAVEKTSIGMEGLIGLNHILGEKRNHCQATVQIAGRACWLPVGEFDKAASRFEGIRPVLMRLVLSFTQRIMQSVACASAHNATQRIACWLLHAHDRTPGNGFALTQQSLSNVLSLRRATVSEACSHLQKTGALSYSRGQVEITNRDILEAQSCECYDTVQKFSILSTH